MKHKLKELAPIYDRFFAETQGFHDNAACSRGCAFCCTEAGSIDITTLEGLHIQEAVGRMLRRRQTEIKKALTVDVITTRIAPGFPKNDGKQTPMKGHPVFIAQHATATCCRGCIKKWHWIEKGRPLSDHEIGFLIDLVMGWIDGQIGP